MKRKAGVYRHGFKKFQRVELIDKPGSRFWIAAVTGYWLTLKSDVQLMSDNKQVYPAGIMVSPDKVRLIDEKISV